MTKPIVTETGVARIIGSAASAISQRSHIRSGARSQPEKAAESRVMLMMQEVVEPISSLQVKPGAMISIEGENTKTKGTSTLPSASRKAVLPVLNGSAPAMLAPA